MEIMTQTEFKFLVARLKETCPLPFPVDIRRTKIKEECYGYCSLINSPRKKFKIRVLDTLDKCATKNILFHEWAHALSWTFTHQEIEDHGPEWGIALSRIWQAMQET